MKNHLHCASGRHAYAAASGLLVALLLGQAGCTSGSKPGVVLAPEPALADAAKPVSAEPGVVRLTPPVKHFAGCCPVDVGFRWAALRAPAAAAEASALVVLDNPNDPVTGAAVPEGEGLTLDFRGYQIRFEDAVSRWTFEGTPLNYMNRLSLEPHVDGTVTRVDAAAYRVAKAQRCAVTSSQVDPLGSIYVLHRGWKVYFCCWGGCGDSFMEDPAAAYAHYGLVDPGPGQLLVAAEH